jgi:signal transduction histidine kinase
MSAGDLSVRAPLFGRDEIGQLASQVNQMAEERESSFARLETERDTLRRFIADASHELRTPITALKNFNELLLGKAKRDRKAREEFLEESKTQLARLKWITDNLLNLSRLDAGLTTLKVEPLGVGKLLETAASSFKVRAMENGITMDIILPDPQFDIRADRALMELALSNLLDNALKYTAQPGWVKLGARRTEGGAHIWVHDNGSGIHPEDLPHIFNRFYRGVHTESEGSGLGLAMVKSVVEAHHGRILVESEPGAGSRFVIQLPGELAAPGPDAEPTV